MTDEKLIAGQLRALQRDVRADLELVRNKVLTTFNRLEHHFDDIIARVSDLERRVSALERARSA